MEKEDVLPGGKIDPDPLPLAQRLVCKALRCGPIPEHVAIIMDGNRRFAEKKRVTRAAGHALGYEKLLSALEWCLELGVEVVSVYAFSIENFKRTREEVDSLMHLAEDRLLSILQHDVLMRKYQIRVRILGNLGLLPSAVQRAAARVMHQTWGNDGGVVNICMSYTGREDMMQAALACRVGVELSLLQPSDVSEARRDAAHQTRSSALLDRCLYTADCPAVSLLVRTSGERRLSDFLLKQSAKAELFFTDVLWPDFSFLDMVRTQFDGQRRASAHLPVAALLQYQKTTLRRGGGWGAPERPGEAAERAAAAAAGAVAGAGGAEAVVKTRCARGAEAAGRCSAEEASGTRCDACKPHPSQPRGNGYSGPAAYAVGALGVEFAEAQRESSCNCRACSTAHVGPASPGGAGQGYFHEDGCERTLRSNGGGPGGGVSAHVGDRKGALKEPARALNRNGDAWGRSAADAAAAGSLDAQESARERVRRFLRLRDDALARWVVQASRAEPEMSCGERDVHRGGREQDGGCSGEGEGSAGQSQRAEKPRGGDGAGPGAGAGAGAGAGLAAASGAGGGHLHAQRQRELLEPLLPGWPPELFLLHHKPPAD